MRCKTFTFIAVVLLLGSPAAAQTTEHELAIFVPGVLGIRLVGSGSGPRAVVFDYGSDPQAYLTAVETGSDLAPTLVQRFEDIEVRAVRNGRWSLHVVATPFTYIGASAVGDLELQDVRVDRGARSGLVQEAFVSNVPGGGPGGPPGGGGNQGGGGGNPNAGNFGYETSWTLADDAQEIAWRTGGTGGWRSLGFSGLDYSLTVDGAETTGTYTTTVTYFLTYP